MWPIIIAVVGTIFLASGLVLLGGTTDTTCPDCGHYSFLEGPPHDKTACEVAKLRKEVAALRGLLDPPAGGAGE